MKKLLEIKQMIAIFNKWYVNKQLVNANELFYKKAI